MDRISSAAGLQLPSSFKKGIRCAFRKVWKAIFHVSRGEAMVSNELLVVVFIVSVQVSGWSVQVSGWSVQLLRESSHHPPPPSAEGSWFN